MKIKAKIIVIKVPIMAPLLSPLIKAWCPQVINAPEESKRTVFSKGIEKGSKTLIPRGGQKFISIVGAKLECKKAQKILKKTIMGAIA